MTFKSVKCTLLDTSAKPPEFNEVVKNLTLPQVSMAKQLLGTTVEINGSSGILMKVEEL